MQHTWAGTAAIYLERRVFVILLLGFASGLPFALVYATLSAWLSEAGVSKTTIGLFVWASAAYALKFLWSPLVDRMPIPLLTPRLGQRRGWMLAAQLAAAAAMVGLGSTEPARDLGWTAFWAVCLAFASATQDIVIDAYRIESLDEDRLGAGAANYVLGYRIAMVASGAGALIIAEAAGWFWAYAVMALFMGVGVLTVLVNPEPLRALPDRDPLTPEAASTDASDTDVTASAVGWLHAAVVAPFADFLARPAWVAILLFIALYKYGDALLGVMATPFYLETGFSKTEIGVVSKTYGVALTVIGGLIGGVLVARLGILPALLVAGVLQALSNLMFALQAAVGYSIPMLALTIAVENLTGGMATTAFVAYLSSLCTTAYTATQYALLSSFMAFARTGFSSAGGWLADSVDWISYFLLTTLAAVPGLVLLLWLMRQTPDPAISDRS